MWAAVCEVSGRRAKASHMEGATADSLNEHYATDPYYTEPQPKHTVNLLSVQYVIEGAVFKALDTLHATATGLDDVPAWFLRLGAAVFAKPLAQLINLSLSTSVVPSQWKRAAKTASPRELSDFRPISITSVLSRVTERLIVCQFLYPAFISQSTSLLFTDQYAFCPTGSTTTALISIFAAITSLLACNDYVVVVAMTLARPSTPYVILPY